MVEVLSNELIASSSVCKVERNDQAKTTKRTKERLFTLWYKLKLLLNLVGVLSILF